VDLHEQADAVCDERTLLEFIAALIADREDEIEKDAFTPPDPYGPGANGCQNGCIETFRSAASAWANSTNFEQSQGLAGNPWRQFEAFLYCGEIYE